MQTTFRLAALTALVAASLISTAVSAAPVSTLFVNGQNRFSDSSAEVAFRPTATGFQQITGPLQVGDLFFSVADYDGAFSPIGKSPTSAGTNELTALALVQIQSFVPISSAACSFSAVLSAGCSTFNMGAVGASTFNSFLTSFGIAPSNPGGLAITNNTIAIFLEDPARNFTREGTIAAGFQTGGDGTLRLVADLIRANGDGFVANAPTSTNDFSAPANKGKPLGNFNFDGTITGQFFPGFVFGPNITGDGTLSSPPTSSGTQFPIFDQSSVNVDIRVIPEPATLALLGLGLIGIAASQRKKHGAK